MHELYQVVLKKVYTQCVCIRKEASFALLDLSMETEGGRKDKVKAASEHCGLYIQIHSSSTLGIAGKKAEA